MAARTLAASVVVTISLAELGCTSSGGVETRNPPHKLEPQKPEELEEPEEPEEPEEVLVGRNPPDPSLASAGEHEAGDDGDAVGNEGGAPEGGDDEGEADDGGGEGPDAAQANVRITQQPDGTCVSFPTDFKCPTGATCNPPPPKPVECPPEQQLPTAKDPADVTKRDNGQCWEHRKIRCPEGARCNPPPPRRVMCPSDADQP